jgi:hypothetical protein
MKMGKTNTIPAVKDLLLRHQRIVSLRERATEVLGEKGNDLFDDMKVVYKAYDVAGRPEFDRWAKNILHHTSRKQVRSREKYVRSCIKYEGRKFRLLEWLEKNPDPYDEFNGIMLDVLDEGESREIAFDPDFQIFLQERATKKTELSVLCGDQRGGPELCKRIGDDRYMDIALRLCEIFNWDKPADQRRIQGIMHGAAKPSVRNPEKYVAMCVRKELEERKIERAEKKRRAARKREREPGPPPAVYHCTDPDAVFFERG